MKTEYDIELEAWLAKNGFQSPAQAQGNGADVSELFIEPDSEMDFFSASMEGNRVRLYDLYGWEEFVRLTELRDWVKANGRISNWQQFEDLPL